VHAELPGRGLNSAVDARLAPKLLKWLPEPLKLVTRVADLQSASSVSPNDSGGVSERQHHRQMPLWFRCTLGW